MKSRINHCTIKDDVARCQRTNTDFHLFNYKTSVQGYSNAIFKGYFLSTIQENQYAKLKKYLTKIPRRTHVGLALLLTHA